MGKLEPRLDGSMADSALAFFFGLPFMIAGMLAMLGLGEMIANSVFQSGKRRRISEVKLVCSLRRRDGSTASRRDFRKGFMYKWAHIKAYR